jgi:hypothetical protein
LGGARDFDPALADIETVTNAAADLVYEVLLVPWFGLWSRDQNRNRKTPKPEN